MIRVSFNDGWMFSKSGPSLMGILGGAAPASEPVQLPYDAMIRETPSRDALSGAQTGFYPGGEYTYTKVFPVPAEWEGQELLVEFEGVYEIAQVYVNEAHVKTNLYGYSGFYADIKDYVKYGEDNTIRVNVNNPTPNSRWYSGSGIYRPVNLLRGDLVHIAADGVKATTLTADSTSAILNIETRIVNSSRKKQPIAIECTLSRGGEAIKKDTVHLTLWAGDNETVRQNLNIPNPMLWNIDTPDLYELNVNILQDGNILDTVSEKIGLRVLSLDAENGLRINGKPVKLKGTCIHHDNGIIGASTFADAEDRRARQMKEAGFNSIRSAHHPMSKAMLDACDKYGIVVMDELADMWYVHKNRNDFATYFENCWQEEVRRIVEKDYDHPCVIMYSSGNEIIDLGNQAGGRINRAICNLFHDLDSTRYTTTAVNGMISAGVSGVMPAIIGDIMKAKGIDPAALQKDGSPEDGIGGMNIMMSLMTDDLFTSHPLMTQALEEASQAEDIAGFNYLTGRHELEKELHPNKPIVGTETFPAEIVRLWRIVEDNPHVLGDYTWTGYDYLGEAGCGIFYYDGTVNFSSHFPDRLAYIGDIDIIGTRRPISYLREIVYGDRKTPYIAVTRLDRYGMKHSQTKWMYKDQVSSWTWPGFAGKPTEVEIFSADEEVELFVNEKSYGKKKAGRANGFIATYDGVLFEPGQVTAVGFCGGHEVSRTVLESAGPDVLLRVKADADSIKADPMSLGYAVLSLTDAQGRENMFAKETVTVSIEGPAVLEGYGSADPQPVRGYQDNTWETYDGKLLCAIRSTGEKGMIKLTFTSADGKQAVTYIQAK